MFHRGLHAAANCNPDIMPCPHGELRRSYAVTQCLRLFSYNAFYAARIISLKFQGRISVQFKKIIKRIVS